MDWRERLMFNILRRVRRLHLDRLLRVGGSLYAFDEYFKGFDKIEAVRNVFGEKTEEVLGNLKVEFTWVGGYMWVNPLDGHLTVSSHYLNSGDRIDIYLDVIHELVHVKQFMEGKELFDSEYSYSERPTEIEAYRVAVREARSLGLSEERICQYLKTEWMGNDDLAKLCAAVGVNCGFESTAGETSRRRT